MASAITSVVSRLGEMAVAEAALLRGVDDYIPLLRDKLEWMQIFIQQESGGFGDNPNVDLWVRQTHELACDVENVLDEFVAKADLGGAEGWPKKWLMCVAGCTTHVSVRHNLKTRMDSIKNRLKEISDNANTYKVERMRSHGHGASASTVPSTAPYSSVVLPFAAWNEETEVVGSVSEHEDLKFHLLGGDTGRSIIAIVGESGAGKSTLAWKVYDSRIIRLHFEVCVWINFPPESRDGGAIIYLIYKRLFPDTDEFRLPLCEVDVHEAIRKYLEDRRCLVMIDGVSNLSSFRDLLHFLPCNGSGSKVMIITPLNSKEVAFANPIVHLRSLNQEDSAQLFCKKVFGNNYQFREKVFDNRNSESDSLMGKLHTDIFEITEGLPLAIVVLAGLLRTICIGDWDKVLKQLKSSTGSNSKPVERILALSYGDLPIYLKSCFLYFAGSPKNMIFSARHLVRLWVAEGFLRPDKKEETMEEIGQNNLRELISRGLITLVRKDLNGGVWLIAIHDRIHAFAESQAQKASFLHVHDKNVDILSPASVRRLFLKDCMHLSVRNTSFPILWSILSDFSEHRLDNVVSFSNIARNRAKGLPYKGDDLRYHAIALLRRCRFLRVVDLQGLRIKRLPQAIGDMVHVRYLVIRSRSLAQLPSTIAGLTKLQTLDIKGTEVQEVPQAFWEIPTLRHVVATKLALPKSSVAQLNNMQTLTGLVCSHPSGMDINPLHNMVYLCYLHLSGLAKQHFRKLEDVFMNLESLLFLHLAGEDIPFKIFTRFYLRRLQTLELTGRIDSSDLESCDKCTLPNLSRLVLKLSMADQFFVNMIGELPSLEELVLSDNSYNNEELVFRENGFSNVTSLVMANLTQLSEWTIRTKSIRKITRIVLSGCSRMKIKLDMEQELDEEGIMEELDEVLLCNMPLENSIIEPANSVFSDKINRVVMTTKREYVADAMQRDGR